MADLKNIIELKNRKSENINKKILQVENVRRNEVGEIIELYVTEIRDDSCPQEVGTRLEASELTRVIGDLIDLHKASSTEKVDYDLSKIVIPDRTRKNFTVSKKGYAGSNITLEIIEGSSVISINDNTVTVYPSSVDKTVKLRATVTNGVCSKSKDFDIVVLRNLTELEKQEEDAASLTIPTQITRNITLPTTGENGSVIKWSLYLDNTLKEFVMLKGKDKLEVVRQNDDYTITLEAEVLRDGCTKIPKSFPITVLGYPTTFVPLNKTSEWIRDPNIYKTETFTIKSSNSKKLFVNVKNYYPDYLDVRTESNNNTSVIVEISEKEGLHNIQVTWTKVLSVDLEVYLDSDRTVLLGVLPCTINYYCLSDEPID